MESSVPRGWSVRGQEVPTLKSDGLAAELPLLTRGRLLTADEAGYVLGVGRRRVFALRDAGTLRGIRIGRSVRFAPSDVLRLLEDGRDEEWR